VKEKEQYEAARRADLRKERDISETQSLLRRGIHLLLVCLCVSYVSCSPKNANKCNTTIGGRAGDGRSVSFMYEPPPGLVIEDVNVIKDEPTATGGAADEAGDEVAEEKKSKKEILEEMRDAKYPWMKNAPVLASYVQGLEVKHNPLGVNLRNVKCFRCQQYGTLFTLCPTLTRHTCIT
jgi:hypothetical protein